MTQRATRQPIRTLTQIPNSRGKGAEPQLSPVDLDRLYREHNSGLTAYLRRQFGDGPPDPEDIAQQAFEKLARRQQSERIDNYPGFLRQTAKNLTISALRHIAVRSNHESAVEKLYFPVEGNDASPERVREVSEQLSIVNEALREMSANLREAFVLNRIDGLSKTEIAKRQGVSRPAVVKRLARASAKINEALVAAMKTKS